MIAAFLLGVVWLNMYGMPETPPDVTGGVHRGLFMRLYSDYCGSRTQKLSIVRNVALLCFTASVVFAFLFFARGSSN